MKTVRLLFSDDMARAIVEGRKTVTRRPVMPQPTGEHADNGIRLLNWRGRWATDSYVAKSLAAPGDLLIGRECWGYRGTEWRLGDEDGESTVQIAYRSDGTRREFVRSDATGIPKQRRPRDGESDGDYDAYISRFWGSWTPSIHMPDWAARIRRRVLGVTVERLQDISEADAVREGFVAQPDTVANPWVFRIEFSAENAMDDV